METMVWGILKEIFFGLVKENDGWMNLFGVFCSSMVICGYVDIKEF